MRLLVVTNDFPPTLGGIENYIYSLIQRWPCSEVTVVTRRVPGWEEFDRAQPFTIIRRPAGTLLPSPRLLSDLRRLVADRSIDVVHFPSCLPLGLMGRALGKPYVLSVHGGEFLLASRLPGVRSLLIKACTGARLILAESSFSARLVRDLAGPDLALQTITCGVDVDRYRRDPAQGVALGSGGPVILSVSRLIPRKGPRTLIRCLPAVLDRHPDAHLAIVGGGPDFKALNKLVVRLGLQSAVTFAGPQPWERLPCYYWAATVFALPTRARFFGTETEGLPLVYVEAAAAGLPLVGGDTGGVADAVRHGETGFLVPGGDVPKTAEAILRLLDDPDLARRLGEAGRKMAKEQFDWAALAGAYRDALSEHCARPSQLH